MSKKIISILLIVTILFSFSGVGYAAKETNNSISIDNSIGTYMVYVNYTECALDINSSGLAQMQATITAIPGVDSVRISMYLQRYNGGWSTVNHWAQNYTGTYGSMNKSYYVTSGYQYRILVYYYAYDGNDSESTTKTDEEWY